MKIRDGIARIEDDRVQAHPAGARLPVRPGAVAAQAGQLCPGLAAVGRAEQRGVLHPGVDGVRIGQRRLEVPDALELPRVRRAVVPLVRAGHAVVGELVAHRLPGLAAVVRALDHLAEPAAGLRRVEPVRIHRRALEVVDLPAPEVRAADVPLLALAVRRQDERALARADEYSYPAHLLDPFCCRTWPYPVVDQPDPNSTRPEKFFNCTGAERASGGSDGAGEHGGSRQRERRARVNWSRRTAQQSCHSFLRYASSAARSSGAAVESLTPSVEATAGGGGRRPALMNLKTSM